MQFRLLIGRFKQKHQQLSYAPVAEHGKIETPRL